MMLTPTDSRGVGRHEARCLTVRLHWVGTRRVALRYVSSCPPLDPYVRLSTSYGSREKDTIIGKVHFASSTEHSPWTALRVRRVPVYCFQTFSLRSFAMYVAFLRSDYYDQFDCLLGLEVSLGSRLPTLHPPLHPIQTLPCSRHRTQTDALGGVFLDAPSALCGSPMLTQGKAG